MVELLKANDVFVVCGAVQVTSGPTASNSLVTALSNTARGIQKLDLGSCDESVQQSRLEERVGRCSGFRRQWNVEKAGQGIKS